jgi:hypothetical protein
VSCPTTSLCVAVTGDWVLTSNNPTGGAAAWTVTYGNGDNNLSGISCPNSGFCVAVDEAGNVVTSTNPMDEAAWKVANVDRLSGAGLSAASCPATLSASQWTALAT